VIGSCDALLERHVPATRFPLKTTIRTYPRTPVTALLATERTSIGIEPMPDGHRTSIARRLARWISTPFLYALMLGIVICAARRPSAGH
jgi:hypothetical protein